MKASVTTRGGLPDAQGSLDNASSLEQVKGVYQPQSKNDPLAYKDIDDGHGGINQTVVQTDGAASSTTMTTTSHDNSPFVMPWHGRF